MLNGGGCGGGKYIKNICIGHVMIGWRAERSERRKIYIGYVYDRMAMDVIRL